MKGKAGVCKYFRFEERSRKTFRFRDGLEWTEVLIIISEIFQFCLFSVRESSERAAKGQEKSVQEQNSKNNAALSNFSGEV